MSEKIVAEATGFRWCVGAEADAGLREKAQSQKHPCPDCCFCQQCGDDRCRLCRESRPAGKRKLSMDEQIALYEALNTGKMMGSL